MSETATIGSTARDFDFLMGSWHVRNLRLRERLAGSNDWEEFEATSVARPLLDGLGNEDEFRTDHDGGFIGMSFRFFDAGSRALVDLLGRQPPLRRARPAGVRHVRRRRRGVRGRGHLRRAADPRPVLLVRRHHPDAALGAVVLRRRRRELGAELGDGVHAGRGRAMSTCQRLPASAPTTATSTKSIAPGAAARARRLRDPEVVRHRGSGRPGPAGDRRAARGSASSTRSMRRSDRARGPRLRHPPPLRRGVLLPPRLHVGRQQRALGDGLGEGRRRRPDVPALAARPRPPSRRSASGSSAPSGTSSRRGAASSAPAEAPRTWTPTSPTPTPGRCEPGVRPAGDRLQPVVRAPQPASNVASRCTVRQLRAVPVTPSVFSR